MGGGGLGTSAVVEQLDENVDYCEILRDRLKVAELGAYQLKHRSRTVQSYDSSDIVCDLLPKLRGLVVVHVVVVPVLDRGTEG